MKLQVLSPQSIVLDTEAHSVTVPGGLGRFTILKNHAPILSTLLAGQILYDSQSLPISGGILRAEDNTIKIYL